MWLSFVFTSDGNGLIIINKICPFVWYLLLTVFVVQSQFWIMELSLFNWFCIMIMIEC